MDGDREPRQQRIAEEMEYALEKLELTPRVNRDQQQQYVRRYVSSVRSRVADLTNKHGKTSPRFWSVN